MLIYKIGARTVFFATVLFICQPMYGVILWSEKLEIMRFYDKGLLKLWPEKVISEMKLNKGMVQHIMGLSDIHNRGKWVKRETEQLDEFCQIILNRVPKMKKEVIILIEEPEVPFFPPPSRRPS